MPAMTDWPAWTLGDVLTTRPRDNLLSEIRQAADRHGILVQEYVIYALCKDMGYGVDIVGTPRGNEVVILAWPEREPAPLPEPEAGDPFADVVAGQDRNS